MISNFLRSLLSEESDPVSTDDAQIALAALLVRIAKSDSQYDKSEVETLKKVLMEQFEMSEEKANSTIHSAEPLAQEAPDTVRFTRALKNNIPYGQSRSGFRKSILAHHADPIIFQMLLEY